MPDKPTDQDASESLPELEPVELTVFGETVMWTPPVTSVGVLTLVATSGVVRWKAYWRWFAQGLDAKDLRRVEEAMTLPDVEFDELITAINQAFEVMSGNPITPLSGS